MTDLEHIRPLDFVHDDGGSTAGGFRGRTSRAIAIATGKPFAEVYDDLVRLGLPERLSFSDPARRDTINLIDGYLESLGWRWTSTMKGGVRAHLRQGELPNGRLIARVSRHLTAVVDGVVHDTEDPTRDGIRTVYGYWQLVQPASPAAHAASGLSDYWPLKAAEETLNAAVAHVCNCGHCTCDCLACRIAAAERLRA